MPADVDARTAGSAPAATLDPQGPPPKWQFRLAWHTIGVALRLAWRVRYVNADRVPTTGPVIIAANHRSFIDPPAVAMGLKIRRPTQFMAKAEMFVKQPGKGFLEGMMAFPVHREQADRGAIKRAIEILSANGQLGMFPEGTRVKEGETAAAQLGVAYIATKTKAPIVPVGIVGTDKIVVRGSKRWHFPPVTIAYGEPIDVKAFDELPRSERLSALTQAIMDGIEAAIRDAEEYARSR